jgi:hypothetical protein
MNKKMSKSTKTYIRRQKAQIRSQFSDKNKREVAIKELYNKVNKK